MPIRNRIERGLIQVGSRLAETASRLVRPQPGDTDGEEGATTVEYAIGTIAAAGFAGLLILILKSDTVRSALEGLIQEALATR